VSLADQLGEVDETVAGVFERLSEVQRNLVIFVEQPIEHLMLDGDDLLEMKPRDLDEVFHPAIDMAFDLGERSV
jgi:hypothetical protein